MSGALLTNLDWPLIVWFIAIGAICNAACAMLGCYLVLRRMSLLGDAISHAVLPGVVLAALASGSIVGWPILLGALAVGILTTLLTQLLHGSGRVPEDASMGVVFTSLFALGVILISSQAHNLHIDLKCVLYGNLENAVNDLVPLPGLGWSVPLVLQTLVPALLATVAFVLLFWKELKICSFDPQLATSMGLRADLVHYLLMGMVAAVTVAALEALGSILVVAMLVVPAAAAHLLSDRLAGMMVWAVALGVLSAGIVGGLVAVAMAGRAVPGWEWVQYLDSNGAGMMAVVAGLLFVLALLLAPRHGLVSRAWHNLRLAVRIASEDVIALLYRAEEKAAQPEEAVQPEEPALLSWASCRRAAGGGWAGWLAVPALWRQGQIHRAAGGFRLTPAGRRLAQSNVRAHRLWETYLGEHFHLPLDHLHEPAERMEHFIGPDLQQELSQELADPARDPHGRPIPPKPENG